MYSNLIYLIIITNIKKISIGILYVFLQKIKILKLYFI